MEVAEEEAVAEVAAAAAEVDVNSPITSKHPIDEIDMDVDLTREQSAPQSIDDCPQS